MRNGNRHAPDQRTGKDRLTDAIMFVGMARDHVIRTHTADSIATMKGVTTKNGVAAIAAALERRLAML